MPPESVYDPCLFPVLGKKESRITNNNRTLFKEIPALSEYKRKVIDGLIEKTLAKPPACPVRSQTTPIADRPLENNLSCVGSLKQHKEPKGQNDRDLKQK